MSLPDGAFIRELDAARDGVAVAGLLERSADYLMLERGEAPGPEELEEFFSDAPPGCDPRSSRRLGLFSENGRLEGIAELAFGFPEPGDAYLGLLLLATEMRGIGWGRAFLDHILGLARMAQAPRIFLGVLDENRRGRAFWEREGFGVVLSLPPAEIGQKWHIRHRMVRTL